MLCRIGKEAFHTRSTSCDCAPTVTLASRQFYYDAEVTSPGFSEIFFVGRLVSVRDLLGHTNFLQSPGCSSCFTMLHSRLVYDACDAKLIMTATRGRPLIVKSFFRGRMSKGLGSLSAICLSCPACKDKLKVSERVLQG